MKSNLKPHPLPSPGFAGPLLALLCLVSPPASRATLPEPDAIFHGAIQLDDRLVTAADTQVQVLAVAVANGTILAGYRMGDNAAAGNRYVLRVPLEAFDPLVNPLALLLGGSVRIQVHDAVGLRLERQISLAERGTIRQLSLSDGPVLPDNNGLPDDWEIHYFGDNHQDPGGDPDRDGKTTAEEFTAGTDPTNPDDVLLLEIGSGLVPLEVVFQTRAASGAGYEGRTRFYSLQQSTDVGASEAWQDVPGFTRVPANGQPVNHQPNGDSGPRFFRIVVALE